MRPPFSVLVLQSPLQARQGWLALTASLPLRGDDADPVGRMCCAAIDGRRAAKSLSALSKRFEITEPELEILWCVGEAGNGGVDQTTLAARLVFSPAQVSACVEKLRVRSLIAHQEAPGDRRRHVWHLSPEAIELLAKLTTAAKADESDPKRPAQAEAA